MGMDESMFRRVLGVRFFVGSAAQAVEYGMRGGLVVVPAAPALITVADDAGYRNALLSADMALTDSMFMVLLWRALEGEWLPRTSGLTYLRRLLTHAGVSAPGRTCWVMPTGAAKARNLEWLAGEGWSASADDHYVAPLYRGGDIDDPALLALVQGKRPAHVIIALGGGTQERVGLFLKQRLDYRPAIHCLGAAVGFLTGDQVAIPVWADTLGLGWLFRCISQPRRFVPRYLGAFRLMHMLWRHRDRLPQMSH
jgi:UDP-N-acetyl-D-mannosaminuronic acid transferase (WecB/TagA/CpsF family)